MVITRIDGTPGQPNFDIFVTYHTNNRLDKSMRALQADPNNADARFQFGMALLNEGKVPEAVASFEQYMKMAPTGQFAGQAKSMLAQLKPPAA